MKEWMWMGEKFFYGCVKKLFEAGNALEFCEVFCYRTPNRVKKA